ncbi:MAG: gamma-glutamylcyclotransferase [Alphaproteobacteria bacterium]|nr:gamma-glutamylcyclotransferase [Alphaproteobacteria bacterium]
MTEDLPVAFYGTLRRGERGFAELQLHERVRFLGSCRIAGVLCDLGAYPGLVEGNGSVVAELYDLHDTDLLGELDYYELYDPARPDTSEFIRRRVRLLEPGREAWVYFYNGPCARPIASGDWLER